MSELLCANCGAANRIPEGRDPAAAKCGKCGEHVLTGKPIEVDAAGLERHRRGTKGAAVLLDVWAPWCGPCLAMAPAFEAAAKRLEPDVRLLKLNSDQNQDAAAALGVRGIPALFLFRDGEMVAQTAGARSAEQLVAWTRQALAGQAAQGSTSRAV